MSIHLVIRASGSHHSHDQSLVSRPFDVIEMPMAPLPRIRVLNQLLFNSVQSERGSKQDGLELAHENLATHLDRLESVGF